MDGSGSAAEMAGFDTPSPSSTRIDINHVRSIGTGGSVQPRDRRRALRPGHGSIARLAGWHRAGALYRDDYDAGLSACVRAAADVSTLREAAGAPLEAWNAWRAQAATG